MSLQDKLQIYQSLAFLPKCKKTYTWTPLQTLLCVGCCRNKSFVCKLGNKLATPKVVVINK